MGLSDIEESLPNLPPKQGIFDSPPIVLNKTKERRPSQASICGVIQLNDGDNMNNNSRHRKQSTLLQYEDIEDNNNGLSLSGNSSDSSYDLHVPQQIIDEDADDDDFDDNKSEHYDNFADIMIQRERDFYLNEQNKKNNQMMNDKNRRQSLELKTGSIGNLGKKRRGSLILNAVDNIKQGIKNMKEKQQQKKESIKELQFMESRKNKLMINYDDVDGDNDEDNDDEKEYYNTNYKIKHQHKRSKDRLGAVRNSLKSIIPNKF